MSWMSQLLKTYEHNAGKSGETEQALTPIAHMYANAQIEVTLNETGELVGAVKIEKNDPEKATLIPVTESSSGRSSGVAPHALCEMLPYIAGDFASRCESEKTKKRSEEKFQAYMQSLQKWNDSEYAHGKARAVYQYLAKGQLISDLIDCGIVKVQENGVFANDKISGQPYEKALVRFRVLEADSCVSAVWKDESLIRAYEDYYLAGQQGRKDICYLIGKEAKISDNHPKGIVASDYGAKLISANDAQGFTYRGRFQDAEQACALSYEASQKIHSALTWLAKTQGVPVGSKAKRTFICWNPENKKLPGLMDEFGFGEEESETIVSYRSNLRKALQGYQNQFTEGDEVLVLALEAATTGRLSITYYQELYAREFFRRLEEWGKTCNWWYLKFNAEKKPYYAVETPIFRRIVECAFGRENAEGTYLEVDDKLLKEQVQRLLKCMLDLQPVPKDIVQALTLRASTPLAYQRRNRERVLSTACAVLVKYYSDRNGKGVSEQMELDVTNRDRSYLFGRLLAVFERVERITFSKDEEREPNAIRYQTVYVNHPLSTWRTLEELLIPYFQKLQPGARKFYKDLIGEIMEGLVSGKPEELNQRLEATYLLGYYLQRAAFTKKDKEKKQEEKDHESVTE